MATPTARDMLKVGYMMASVSSLAASAAALHEEAQKLSRDTNMAQAGAANKSHAQVHEDTEEIGAGLEGMLAAAKLLVASLEATVNATPAGEL